MDNLLSRCNLERVEKWRDWIDKLPTIPLDTSICRIKVIPPFGGALIRFRVYPMDTDEISVSVYLDVNQSLGIWDGPYWEIYPATNNDTKRFELEDVEHMCKEIIRSLQIQKE